MCVANYLGNQATFGNHESHFKDPLCVSIKVVPSRSDSFLDLFRFRGQLAPYLASSRVIAFRHSITGDAAGINTMMLKRGTFSKHVIIECERKKRRRDILANTPSMLNAIVVYNWRSLRRFPLFKCVQITPLFSPIAQIIRKICNQDSFPMN